MKILFISTLSHIQWGGSEELWIRTALKALENNISVDVLAYKWPQIHSKLELIKDKGANIYFRNTIYNIKGIKEKLINRFFDDRISVSILQTLFYKNKPDFIIVSQGGTFDLGYSNQTQLVNYLKKTEVPFKIICQNNADVGFVPEKEVRDKISEIFMKAKEVHFVSKRNLQVAERQLCYKFRKASTISNPVNLKEIRIQEWNGIDTAQFAMVAALKCSHKGQDILFEVLSSPTWKERNWCLNLYGKGEDYEYLKQLAVFFSIQDKVILHNHVEDICEVWKQNHILLLPSLGEGMPLALQEAMLCGRSAVVTDVAGNSELIIEGQTGFLAEAPTVKLFEAAMERAWNGKDEWKEMGVAAYNFAQNYIDLYPENSLLTGISKQR